MTIATEPKDYMTPALETWRRWTDLPLVLIALGTLPLLLLELARGRLIRGDRVMLDITGVIVLVAFTTDFVAELITCKERAFYLRREWLGIVIVLAQAVALVPALSAAGILRVFRAGRVVALVGALAGQGRKTVRQHAASLALGTAGMVWLTAAVVFTLVEDVGVHGRVHSFFDALWWSTATITTVGYGDITPVTVIGRIAGMITMVVGISAFAVVTAKIAQVLVLTDREAKA